MGFFSNKVKRENLVAGDHIYVWRAGFVYAHHGIYVGNNRVIHFRQTKISISITNTLSSSNGGVNSFCRECACIDPAYTSRDNQVICTCLDCFLKGNKLRRCQYGVSEDRVLIQRGGCCSMLQADANEMVIHRATYLLQHEGFPAYDLFTNNCEDFARYCKIGYLPVEIRGMSGQMRAKYAVLGLAQGFLAGAVLQDRPAARAREKFVKRMLKYENVDNLKRVEVEDLVSGMQ